MHRLQELSNLQVAGICSVFAGIGGCLHYLLKCKEGKDFEWKDLALHSLISSFSGLIFFELFTYWGIPPEVGGALCGLCGWSATRLLRIMELLAYAKAGVSKEEVEK